MSVSMERRVLLDALQVVKENIQPTDDCERSSYAIFQDSRLHGYSDSVGVTVPLNAELPNCAVDLQLLYDFLRKMKEKEIIIGTKDGNLRIVGKTCKADFAIREDFSYPRDMIMLDTTRFTRLPEAFGTALSCTGFACDPDRSDLCRTAVKDGVMYGLSGRRAARYYMGDEAKSLFPEVTFVAPECQNFVNKMKPTSYYVDGGWIHLYDKEMRIYSSRTRADNHFQFEVAEELLAVPSSDEFLLPPGFEDVLDRATPFSGKTSKVRKLKLDFRDNRLDVTAIREDGSTYMERCEGVVAKNNMQFTVNLRLISDIVKLAHKYKLAQGRLVGLAPSYVTMAALDAE